MLWILYTLLGSQEGGHKTGLEARCSENVSAKYQLPFFHPGSWFLSPYCMYTGGLKNMVNENV